MIPAAASRESMLADDRAALTAGAAPGVADPVQTVASERFIAVAHPDRPDTYIVRHRSQYPCTPVKRQCVSCGVVAYCDPALPCCVCNASPFHLIPLASTRSTV